MSISHTFEEPGDVIYTISADGNVRSFIVQDDGSFVEITLAEAHRAGVE